MKDSGRRCCTNRLQRYAKYSKDCSPFYGRMYDTHPFWCIARQITKRWRYSLPFGFSQRKTKNNRPRL